MRLTLSPSDRRTLLYGGAIVLAIILGVRGGPALAVWSRARIAHAESSAAELRRLEHALERQGRTRAILAQVTLRLAAYDSAVLVTSGLPEASASLAAIISDAAEGAELDLGAIRLEGDSIGDTQLLRARARASVSGDLESIALFLEMLEVGPQLLAIREISLSTSEGMLSSAHGEVVRAELTVEGVYVNPRYESAGK